jgi:CRISPR-associated endonuclease Csn1
MFAGLNAPPGGHEEMRGTTARHSFSHDTGQIGPFVTLISYPEIMNGQAQSAAYRVGIDVGLNSVGLAAISVDEAGAPQRLLNMETIIHDGGIDPSANKTKGTRRAESGAARRMRRLYRQRRRRLANLDNVIERLGWPLIDLETQPDPWFPWRARAELLTAPVADQERLLQLMSVAVCHMARHRGWRNPYMSVASVLQVDQPSRFFVTMAEAVAPRLGLDAADIVPLAPAELVSLARSLDIDHQELQSINQRTGEITIVDYFDVSRKVRGTERISPHDNRRRIGLFESKIHQSDNARELRRIWSVQGLGEPDFKTVANAVFQARSPKGSAKSRVGSDPFDHLPRAEKASLAFQRYRIVTILANIRLASTNDPLSVDQRRLLTDFLWDPRDAKGRRIDDVSWADVAAQLGLERSQLRGMAKETDEGDRPSAHPPVNVTADRITGSGIKELVAKWRESGEPAREALIEAIGNGSGSGAESGLLQQANDWLA